MAQKERTFVVLDGLRGVAALAILLRHGDMYFGNRLYESYLAVDFFFALSGFVLMHAYGGKIAANALSTPHFLSVRFIRLYPLYILSVILSAALISHDKLALGTFNPTAMLVQLMAAAAFMPNVFGVTTLAFPLNAPSWSLYCEFVANFAFSGVLRRLGLRGIAAVTAIAALVLIWAALNRRLGFGLWTDSGLLDNGFQAGSVTAGLVRVAYSFFCGALLYRLWLAGAGRFSLHPLVIAAALFALLAAHPYASLQPAFDLAATLLLFPLLIWLGASARATGALNRVFEILGTASYGVYILQIPVYHLAIIVSHRLQIGPRAAPWFGLGAVAALFGAVMLLDRYFDLPLRRKWMRRLAARAPGRTARASAVA